MKKVLFGLCIALCLVGCSDESLDAELVGETTGTTGTTGGTFTGTTTISSTQASKVIDATNISNKINLLSSDFISTEFAGDPAGRYATSTDCATVTASMDDATGSFDMTIAFADGCVIDGVTYGGSMSITGTMTMGTTTETEISFTYTSTVTFTDLSIDGEVFSGSQSASVDSTTTFIGSGEEITGFDSSITSDLDFDFTFTESDGNVITMTGDLQNSVDFAIDGFGTETATFSVSISLDGDYTYADPSEEIDAAITIVTPLTLENCDYFTTGIVNIVNDASLTVINYGDGVCDDQATVTNPDGTTTTITLPSYDYADAD